VLLFEFSSAESGGEGAMTCEIKKPNRTTNGNARMQSTMSRLRVLMVMLLQKSGRKIAAVNHSRIATGGNFI
jgi:hypothetical protein